MENTQQKEQKGGKLTDWWLGPYTISRNLGKGVYELKNLSGRTLKKKFNIARPEGWLLVNYLLNSNVCIIQEFLLLLLYASLGVQAKRHARRDNS